MRGLFPGLRPRIQTHFQIAPTIMHVSHTPRWDPPLLTGYSILLLVFRPPSTMESTLPVVTGIHILPYQTYNSTP
ncbi:hypothetical protein L218DRAFT_963491 [Marasmius fiardii PR-910]|nr:hypothetical protein L218DRAFT_963491 [Marasmius fiardii PR-910]